MMIIMRYEQEPTPINGKKLDVRGCIGAPMLGGSQTWLRQE
ncbi:MAG TPA: hypothetical protein VJO99_23315 [Burkholderiaceae bacterium]|nr:hypothetical protein [Burkholderiaceae bacterium]